MGGIRWRSLHRAAFEHHESARGVAGQDSFGITYRARDRRLDRDIAEKSGPAKPSRAASRAGGGLVLEALLPRDNRPVGTIRGSEAGLPLKTTPLRAQVVSARGQHR